MKKIILILTILIVFLALSVILEQKFNQPNKEFSDVGLENQTYFAKENKEKKMKLTTVFEHNKNIPSIYTCDGEDLAPELTISDVPANAKELVLIVDDPDAPMGTWVHWLVYNIPANTTKIDAKNLPQGSKQGITDFGRIGWGGPCPPSGTHRYFFKLYAIDEALELKEGLTKSQLEHAIKGHVIEQDELIGLYKRT